MADTLRQWLAMFSFLNVHLHRVWPMVMGMFCWLEDSEPLLPSIKPTLKFLDLEKIKRENYSQRQSVSATLNMPAPPLISPSNIYSGPPPPYSYPSSTACSVIGGYVSPAEPRKTCDEDNESLITNRHSLPDKESLMTHRHSLPSIHEALGNDPPLSIPSLLSKPTPLQIPDSNHNQSPTTAIPRSYSETPRVHPNLLTQQSPTTYHFRDSVDKRPQFSPRASNASVPPRFPAASSHDNHYPSIQPSRTAASPAHPMRPTSQAIPTQQLSPVYDRNSRGPQTNPPYSYGSYAVPYSYPSTSASIPSFQPLQPPTWRGGGDVDRAEEVRRSAGKPSPRPQYGESVKRHLEAFDLETSLNTVRFSFRKFFCLMMCWLWTDCGGQPPRFGVRSEIWNSSTPGRQDWDSGRWVTKHRRVHRDDPASKWSAWLYEKNQERHRRPTTGGPETTIESRTEIQRC